MEKDGIQKMVERKTSQNSKYIVAAFMSVVLFVITYKYTLNLVRYDGINDMLEHMWHAESIFFSNFGEKWLERPYFLWHVLVKGSALYLGMPMTEATAFVCGFMSGVTCLVTFFVLDKIAMEKAKCFAGNAAACAAGALGFVQPLYMHWFNEEQYLGQFSPNPIHNPTQMVVIPFGILAFAFGVDLIRRFKGKRTIFVTSKLGQKYLFVLFGFMLFMLGLAKPTFMYMLLPAGGLLVLIEWIQDIVGKKADHKKTFIFMRNLLLSSIPALIYLALQYTSYYVLDTMNDDAGIGIYRAFYVWEDFTTNIGTSVILAMAFPLYMVITNIKYFLNEIEGKLALLAYVVGTLEFTFFVETGVWIGCANFAWCMMAGMTVLWVTAVARLLVVTYSDSSSRFHVLMMTCGWILLFVHFFSGLYFINPYMYII